MKKTIVFILFLAVSLVPFLASNNASSAETPPPSTTSAPGYCGDGVLDAGEECDDGNHIDGDGCNSLCLREEQPPYCGNGVVDLEGEECDDGNNDSGDGCDSYCQREQFSKEDVIAELIVSTYECPKQEDIPLCGIKELWAPYRINVTVPSDYQGGHEQFLEEVTPFVEEECYVWNDKAEETGATFCYSNVISDTLAPYMDFEYHHLADCNENASCKFTDYTLTGQFSLSEPMRSQGGGLRDYHFACYVNVECLYSCNGECE